MAVTLKSKNVVGQGRQYDYTANLNGTTAVEIATDLATINSVLISEAAELSNPTYKAYVYSVSGGAVNIKCTHDGETGLCYVRITGSR